MRSVTLSAVKAGITRLRDKGGAATDSLYDLINGYVTAARTIRNRPGTIVDHVLPAGTKGLLGFQGKKHVCAAEPVPMTDENYVCHVLRHPTDLGRSLAEVHFFEPFMGHPYIAAEFDNGDIYHYWMEEVDEWQPETVYQLGDRVIPSTPNGYMYVATRGESANPVWAAGVSRTVGEVIEPTEFNGYKYECIDTSGVNPASGPTEPTWVAADGGITVELSDVEPPPTPAPPEEDDDEGGGGYTNPGGGLPGRPGPGEWQEK